MKTFIYITIFIVTIVFCLFALFFMMNNMTGCFEESTTAEEREIFYELLDSFNKVTEKHGIDNIACSGTWIGSIRHGDIIPWDDDMDVAIKNSDFEKMPPVIEELKEKYGIDSSYENRLHFHRHRMFKIFYPSSSPKAITKYPGHNWPYIDVFFETKENTPDDCYIEDSDYPIKKGKLGPIDINLPNREFPEKIMEECVDTSFRHKYEIYYPKICPTKKCSELI